MSGIDIVLNHRLVETGFGDKKAFTDYLKSYMKKVVKYLEEHDRAAEVDGFKTNIQKVNSVISLLDDWLLVLIWKPGVSFTMLAAKLNVELLTAFLA